MLAYIYTLSDPRTGAIRYVGKTNNPRVRLWMHKKETRNTRKNAWIKSLASVGLAPEMDVIEEMPHDPDSLWQEAEIFWIASLKFLGCNLTNEDSGGASGFRKSEHSKNLMRMKATGRIMSPEAVARMVATKAARMTPEIREKIAAGQRGKKQSAEHRAAIAAGNTGRVFSAETRAKIGAANKISRERYLALHPPKSREPKVKLPRKPVSDETKVRMRIARAAFFARKKQLATAA